MFQESFYMFKTFKKNMWTSGFFNIKSLFLLSNVHQIVSIFFWTLMYSIRRDPCVQNIHKKKTYTFLDLNIRMSFYPIIVLNL
jgi:hypothetical protein